MRYLPHTPAEIDAMLERIGAPSLDALFEAIPASHRLSKRLALPAALDEASLMSHLAELAARNGSPELSFLGGGAYDHHIPPVVDQLLLRGEFYTAYTPYQAEVAQGTLQAIYEFQTLVCELFGMDVANASMYDGASATAEAVLMARRIAERTRCVISEGLHPQYVETTRTYLQGLDGADSITTIPCDATGRTDLRALRDAVDSDTAAVVVGYPNFFGCVEDLEAIRRLAAEAGSLLVTSTWEPVALGLLAAPGRFGVDIAVGEGQPLAVPPQFGGPGVGLFACRQAHLRQLPGRLVGETVDVRGQRGYTLTLSAREQHIRRERATSNICTNHGLIALALTIRVALLGKSGLRELASLILSRTEYLKAELGRAGFVLPYCAPTFNEFVVRRPHGRPAGPLLERLAEQRILAGLDLSMFFAQQPTDMLVAVTERHDRPSLDRLVRALIEADRAQ